MLSLSLVSSQTLLTSKYRDLLVAYTDPGNGREYPPLYFNIRTYDKISGTSASANGDAILAPLIRFVESLSDRNQKILYRYYADVHSYFTNLDEQEIITDEDHDQMINQLQRLTSDMVEKTGLCKKLLVFVNTPEFVYPDESSDDKNRRDKSYYYTDEMTFSPSEVRDMTALSMLFKILIPVWGEYIAHFDIFSINPLYREEKAIEIVDEVLEHSIFSRTYAKFSQYTENIIKREITHFNKDQNKTIKTEHILSFHNLTEDVFSSIIEATILLKKTVLYECGSLNALGKVSSIMVYICTGLCQTTKSTLSNLSQSVTILPLNEQDQREGDENNQSAMEYYSKASDTPADYPVFIEVMLERDIPNIARDFGVTMEQVDSLTDFYKRSPFERGPLAYSCVASLVGNRAGGSASLEVPMFTEFAKLIAITQHFMARNGLFSLIPLLSAKDNTLMLDTELDADMATISRIKEGLAVDLEYEKLLENYTGFTEKTIVLEKKKKGKKAKTDVVRIDVERQITRLITWGISQNHIVNIPGSFWDEYPIENPPVLGSVYAPPDTLLSDLCRFYRFFHDKKTPIAWK